MSKRNNRFIESDFSLVLRFVSVTPRWLEETSENFRLPDVGDLQPEDCVELFMSIVVLFLLDNDNLNIIKMFNNDSRVVP